jgi:tripartite-type tricarboxylate transporter receptor subunit TctC
MNHQKLLAKLLIGSAAFAAVALVHAAPYPERPIRVVVTSSPGSGLDTVARTLSEDLGNALGQPIVVENKAGAAGIPGTREIVAAAPNGYTLGLISSNHAINPSLNKSLPYDSVKDLTAITLIGTVPVVLAVPANSPYKTVQDLVKAAKAKPSALNYGSSGSGSALHLATLLLETKAGIKMTHIPYKGGSALVTDLISGQIDAAFLAIPTAYAQIKAGTIKALGVSTKGRLALLPDTPSLQEAGVKDYEYVPWIGLIGPAGMDKDTVALLRKKVADVAALPKVKSAFDAQGFTPDVSSPEQFLDTIKRDIDLSATLIKQAALQPGS